MPWNGKSWPKGVVAAGVAVLALLVMLSVAKDSVTVRRWFSVACGSIHRTSGKAETFYEYNPTYVDPNDDSKAWRFSSPAVQGMDPVTLENGLMGLSRENSLLSVLVIRKNRMVAEQYFHGGGVRKSNNVHSASKSMMQALVGIAVAKGFIGSLDDKVSKYLPEYLPDTSARKRQISLRDLLTMSSGLAWQEDDTEYKIEQKPDWVKAILDQPLQHDPGTVFNYSTGNTHVLSAVLQRATGMSTCDFAARYLFGRKQSGNPWRSCCDVGLGMAELPSAACGGEFWAGFAGLRIAEVTGRDRDHWRNDGGRVLGGSRAGRGPGRLRLGQFRHCGRILAGSRSAGRGARCRARRRWR